jgi:hypothetical protein
MQTLGTREFANGGLEITPPVAAATLPRKIEMKPAAPFAKAIVA